MEPETISKNGESLKRHRSKENLRSFYYGCFALMLSIFFASCATVFSGDKQKITITGKVDVPVQLLVDGKTYSNVKLPAKVKINRKNETSKIVAFVPNHILEKQKIEKTFNHTVWINASGLLFLPAFMYVDWNTGANKRAVQKKITLEFTRANSEKEIFDTYIDFGTEYYNHDQLSMALLCFQQAHQIDDNNEIALQKINAVYNRMDYLEEQARLKSIRAEKWANALMITGQMLSTTAEIAGTLQSSNGSNENSSSISSGNRNCENLQSTYDRFKRQAGGASDTYRDARLYEKVGAETGGKVGDNSGSNAAVKSSAHQLARTAQREMQKLEQEARKCGCNLH